MSPSSWRHRISPRRRVVSSIGFGIAMIAIVAAVALGSSRTPTKGPIPDAAFRPGQPMDLSTVPDFVPALDRSGNVAGYVRKEMLTTSPPTTIEAGRPVSQEVPVYADDLVTLVGHMVPGKGFVPSGTDPESVPNIPVFEAPAP